MAATTGFGQFSSAEITSPRLGGCGGLPNSVMSAPAMKVRPPQVSTIAFTSASEAAVFTFSKMPRRTAAESAFTGGLFTVTMAIAPAAMALGYAALANLGVRHLSEPFREELMRETGGAVAIGARDRVSMIYVGQSRNGLALGVQLDVGSRIPIATTAMGRAYIWALPDEERATLLREFKEHYGSRWSRMRDGIERSGEMIDRHGFALSVGEWQEDDYAAGVA